MPDRKPKSCLCCFEHLASKIETMDSQVMLRDLQSGRMVYSQGCARLRVYKTAAELSANTHISHTHMRRSDDAKSLAIKTGLTVRHVMDVYESPPERSSPVRMAVYYRAMHCSFCPLACGLLLTVAEPTRDSLGTTVSPELQLPVEV